MGVQRKKKRKECTPLLVSSYSVGNKSGDRHALWKEGCTTTAPDDVVLRALLFFRACLPFPYSKPQKAQRRRTCALWLLWASEGGRSFLKEEFDACRRRKTKERRVFDQVFYFFFHLELYRTSKADPRRRDCGSNFWPPLSQTVFQRTHVFFSFFTTQKKERRERPHQAPHSSLAHNKHKRDTTQRCKKPSSTFNAHAHAHAHAHCVGLLLFCTHTYPPPHNTTQNDGLPHERSLGHGGELQPPVREGLPSFPGSQAPGCSSRVEQ